MAIVTYPLNDVDYTAEDAELFHCTRTSGIHADSDFSYSVTGADNNVTIGPGIAWIHNSTFSGKVAAMKVQSAVDLGVPDSTYQRIDAIVLQFNASENETKLIVKHGTAASSPVAPDVIRTEAVYELHLYRIRREAGATAVTAADISDLRLNRTYCGLMADSVTNIDTSAINKQVDSLLTRLETEIKSRLEALDDMVNNQGKTGVPTPSVSKAGFFPRVNDDGSGYELVDLLSLYIWKKYENEPIYTKTNVTEAQLGVYMSGSYSITYADSFTVSDGSVSLVNSKKLINDGIDADEDVLSAILGKYVYSGVTCYYIDPLATFKTKSTGSGTGMTTTLYATKGAKIEAGTPDPIGYVASESKNAYPTSGEHTDGYWYEYRKQLGD